jgi:hypothetical protein
VKRRGSALTRRQRERQQRDRDWLVTDGQLLVSLLAQPPWRITEILLEMRDLAGEPGMREHLTGMVHTGRALRRLGQEIVDELGPVSMGTSRLIEEEARG